MSALTGAAAVWSLDVGAGDGGLVAEGDTLQWAWSPAPAAGPVGEPSWGTVPDARYLNDASDSVVIPLPPMVGIADPRLVIDHWYDVRSGDTAVVEADSGLGYARVEPTGGYPAPDGFVGASGGWSRSTFRIDPAATRVRLRLGADASGANDGWYLRGVELVDGDAGPPTLVPSVPLGDTQDLVGPWPVVFTATDDTGVIGVDVHLVSDSGEVVVPLARGAGDRWEGSVPAQPLGFSGRWYAVADDGIHTTQYPASGASPLRVFLAAPEDVRADTGERGVAQQIELTWDPPQSPEVPVGYRVYGVVGAPIDVGARSAVVSLSPGGPQTFWVSAVYAAGEGDPSAEWTGDVLVPELVELSPPSLWAGDNGYIVVSGRSLFLDRSSAFDLGDGVDVLTFDVIDVDTAVARVHIDAAAVVGPKDLAVATPFGVWSFPEAFYVGDPADAPRVVSVDPPRVERGAEASITITVSEPFHQPDVAVDAPADLLVTELPPADADTITVRVAAATRAGIGAHELVLDDGARLWTATIEVVENARSPQRNCEVGGGTHASVAVAVVAAAAAWTRAGRRRRA